MRKIDKEDVKAAERKIFSTSYEVSMEGDDLLIFVKTE